MEEGAKKSGKQHNFLPIWGNEATMNLNPLILANIQGSSYFKVHLFKLKTYHEVVDEIYYQVKHMEPWERGSRKTAGQTGMCGGVRGVGAGGIVSSAFCLLYKLYTLRLTRKQVNGLLNHIDSPYIRALGFMYLRYTQPPGDLFDWYADYLQDEEEIDVKAGGGQVLTMGQMVYQFLTKLDWFSTLFPRIPVPIQKQIEKKLDLYCRDNQISIHMLSQPQRQVIPETSSLDYETEEVYDRRGRVEEPHSSKRGYHSSEYYDDRDRERGRERERDRNLVHHHSSSSSHRRHRHRDDDSGHKHKKKAKHKNRSRSKSRSRSRSRNRYDRKLPDRHSARSRDYQDDRRYR